MLRRSESQGPARRGRRPPRRADARAPGRAARGHRRRLLVPRPRRGQLRHRAGHRRQRRPQHLTPAADASFVLFLPPGMAGVTEIGPLRILCNAFYGGYASAMARNRPTAEAAASDRPGSWRELAVARSLDPARARAEERVQRFLDAAVELMTQNDTGKDFTVQDVVERSGPVAAQLLPVLRGQARAPAGAVRGVGALDGRAPAARRSTRSTTRSSGCTASPSSTTWCAGRPPSRGGAKKGGPPTPMAMAEFGQKLLTEHPKEASRAFVPVVSLFEQLLDDAGGGRGHPRRACRTASVAGVAAAGDHVQRLRRHDQRHADPRPTATTRPSSCGTSSSTASGRQRLTPVRGRYRGSGGPSSWR